jgi:hypothetical protein
MDLDHRYGGGGFLGWPINRLTEVAGQIYTCALGFIDIGHVRDLADLTRFHYLSLNKGGRWRAGSKFPTFDPDGEITITKDVPKEQRLMVARSIAYDESVYHEIESYWSFFPGYHNSSFSPEDCVSNLLGTWMAQVTIEFMASNPLLAGDFDEEMTATLRSVLVRLGARLRSGTEDAFARISALAWVDYSGPMATFLRRRNFNYRPVLPWLVPGVVGCPAGSVPAEFEFELPAELGSFYDIQFAVKYKWYERDGVVVTVIAGVPWFTRVRDGQMIPGWPTAVSKATFASEIQRIRDDALARYGALYDQP